MASGHMNRVKRPDTWLHRPMLQNVKKVLANPEPSTHDPAVIPDPTKAPVTMSGLRARTEVQFGAVRPGLMLWTAPPPARECHGCGGN